MKRRDNDTQGDGVNVIGPDGKIVNSTIELLKSLTYGELESLLRTLAGLISESRSKGRQILLENPALCQALVHALVVTGRLTNKDVPNYYTLHSSIGEITTQRHEVARSLLANPDAGDDALPIAIALEGMLGNDNEGEEGLESHPICDRDMDNSDKEDSRTIITVNSSGIQHKVAVLKAQTGGASQSLMKFLTRDLSDSCENPPRINTQELGKHFTAEVKGREIWPSKRIRRNRRDGVPDMASSSMLTHRVGGFPGDGYQTNVSHGSMVGVMNNQSQAEYFGMDQVPAPPAMDNVPQDILEAVLNQPEMMANILGVTLEDMEDWPSAQKQQALALQAALLARGFRLGG